MKSDKDKDEGLDKDLSNPPIRKNPSYSSTMDMPDIVESADADGVASYRMEMQRTESFSGPLPSPRVLKGYAELIPDAPERILRMAESQHQHDIDIDKQNVDIARTSVEGGLQSAKRGQILAFILALVLIACGVYLTVSGFEAVGLVIFSTTLVAVIANFLASFIRKDKDGSKR